MKYAAVSTIRYRSSGETPIFCVFFEVDFTATFFFVAAFLTGFSADAAFALLTAGCFAGGFLAGAAFVFLDSPAVAAFVTTFFLVSVCFISANERLAAVSLVLTAVSFFVAMSHLIQLCNESARPTHTVYVSLSSIRHLIEHECYSLRYFADNQVSGMMY